MVHFGDAAAAVAAVVRTGRLQGIALFTPSGKRFRGWFGAGFGLWRRRRVGELVSARVDGAGFVVSVPDAGDETVEDEGLATR